jgi:hypothetical protein
LTAIVVVTPDELRAIVREELGACLATREPASTLGALVDKRRLADALGVSVATIDRQSAKGRIPFLLVGEHRRYDIVAVRAALEAVPAVAPAAKASRELVSGVRRLSRTT